MVEIPGLGVRGVVKREDLPDGRWRFEAHRMAWVSFDGRMVQSGMSVPLRIIAINIERRFVDFKLAGKPSSPVKLVPPRRPAPAAKKHDKPKPAAKAGPPQHRKPTRKPKHRRH
jgi:hypothetical protein